MDDRPKGRKVTIDGMPENVKTAFPISGYGFFSRVS